MSTYDEFLRVINSPIMIGFYLLDFIAVRKMDHQGNQVSYGLALNIARRAYNLYLKDGRNRGTIVSNGRKIDWFNCDYYMNKLKEETEDETIKNVEVKIPSKVSPRSRSKKEEPKTTVDERGNKTVTK